MTLKPVFLLMCLLIIAVASLPSRQNWEGKSDGLKAGYDDVEVIRNTVNGAYDRIIEVACRDLQGEV